MKVEITKSYCGVEKGTQFEVDGENVYLEDDEFKALRVKIPNEDLIYFASGKGSLEAEYKIIEGE